MCTINQEYFSGKNPSYFTSKFRQNNKKYFPNVQLFPTTKEGQRPVLSLHDAGVARLIFNSDYTSFRGVLINYQEETFAIMAEIQKDLQIDMENNCSSGNSGGNSNESNMTNGVGIGIGIVNSSAADNMDFNQLPGTSFNVTLIDGETGSEFLLKKVMLTVINNNSQNHSSSPTSNHPHVICELKSDAMQFKTDEVLVGNRADVEIRSYLSPDLVGECTHVHMGTMSINFQTSVTPPPTPQRDSTDGEVPMEECDDFLHWNFANFL